MLLLCLWGIDFKSATKTTFLLFNTTYKFYFDCQICDLHNNWAPIFCYITRSLTKGHKGTHKSMPFAMLTVWREPRCYITDCYFCMTSTVGLSRKSKQIIQYPNIPSILRPVLHNKFLPILVPLIIYRLKLLCNWDKSGKIEHF